jgi:hypothetical protein
MRAALLIVVDYLRRRLFQFDPVADLLGLKTATAGKHLERIYLKLGVENRAGCSQLCIGKLKGKRLKFQLSDFSWSDDFDRAFRERLEKSAPIGLGHDPIIENHDDAVVALGPDQAADALPEFQNRFRQ